MAAETFTCELCGKTFLKEWSDEECKAEYEERFGQAGDEPPAVVCEDCYRMLIGTFGYPINR